MMKVDLKSSIGWGCNEYNDGDALAVTPAQV